MKKNILLNRCAGTKIVIHVAIDHTDYQSKKTAGKNYSSSFLRSFY